eukprot:1943813-Prymnesium_polylepis.3
MLSCCSVAFCTSSARMYMSDSDRPLRSEKSCSTSCPLSIIRCQMLLPFDWPRSPSITCSAGLFRSTSTSCSLFVFSRAFHSGRARMICFTAPFARRRRPSCTASVVFPVPGGPRVTIVTIESSWMAARSFA